MKKEFDTLAHAIKKGFDGVDERFKKVDGQFEKMEKDFDRKLESMMGKLKTELKDYIDKKNIELRGDIVATVKGDRDRDRRWKEKAVAIFERHKLADPQEADLMAELIH